MKHSSDRLCYKVYTDHILAALRSMRLLNLVLKAVCGACVFQSTRTLSGKRNVYMAPYVGMLQGGQPQLLQQQAPAGMSCMHVDRMQQHSTDAAVMDSLDLLRSTPKLFNAIRNALICSDNEQELAGLSGRHASNEQGCLEVRSEDLDSDLAHNIWARILHMTRTSQSAYPSSEIIAEIAATESKLWTWRKILEEIQ